MIEVNLSWHGSHHTTWCRPYRAAVCWVRCTLEELDGWLVKAGNYAAERMRTGEWTRYELEVNRPES